MVKFIFDAIDYLYYFNHNGYVNKYKDVEIKKDVVYSNKHVDCKFNIHELKNNKKKKPLAIFIHGGGFVAGGKKFRKRYPNYLANLGFKVINVDYPLSHKMRFHEQVYVIADLLNYISNNQKELNIDISNSLVCGDSAGGYMSALTSVIANNKSFREKFNLEINKDIKIKNAVLLCGMYDLAKAMIDLKAPKFAKKKILQYITGIKFKKEIKIEEYKYHKELLILNYINKDFPTSFVCHVKNDMFCLNQGYYMEDKLKENNVNFESFVAPAFGNIHDFVMCDYNKATKKVQKLITGFLKKQYPDL